MRLYVYVNGVDKLVGVEQCEINSATGKPYNMANPELNDLPVIGREDPESSGSREDLSGWAGCYFQHIWSGFSHSRQNTGPNGDTGG